MKTVIAMSLLFALSTASGCWSTGTTMSPKGGIIAQDEEFSITTPSCKTIKQGEAGTVMMTMTRGAYFKQDVQIDIKTEGISVTPTSVVVKASEKAELQLQVMVARDAAIGDYHVYVKAAPITGKPVSSQFTVKVIAQ